MNSSPQSAPFWSKNISKVGRQLSFGRLISLAVTNPKRIARLCQDFYQCPICFSLSDPFPIVDCRFGCSGRRRVLYILLQNSMKTLKSTNFQVRKGTLSPLGNSHAAAGQGPPSQPENRSQLLVYLQPSLACRLIHESRNQ